jgi:hypothetical protein
VWAGKILNAYPDYAKATPGYTAAIVEVMAGYSETVQARLADKHMGILSRCKFLPVVAEIVELGNAFADADARSEKHKSWPKLVPFKSESTGTVCCFPQLEREFGLAALRGMRFETHEAACNALVKSGREAAASLLGIKP